MYVYNPKVHIKNGDLQIEAVVAQGHKGVTVTRRLWVPSLLEGMNYYFLTFSFLCSGTKAKSPALTTASCFQNSAESGLWEWPECLSVLN